LEDAIAAIDKIAMPIDAQDRKFFLPSKLVLFVSYKTLPAICKSSVS
jgi:hypothetical protein